MAFGYELARHLKSACIETRRHAAAVRLGRSPPLLAGLAAPVGDGGGADPEAARNLNLAGVAALAGDEKAFAQISGIELDMGASWTAC
jgi:hypothetical protein